MASVATEPPPRTRESDDRTFVSAPVLSNSSPTPLDGVTPRVSNTADAVGAIPPPTGEQKSNPRPFRRGHSRRDRSVGGAPPEAGRPVEDTNGESGKVSGSLPPDLTGTKDGPDDFLERPPDDKTDQETKHDDDGQPSDSVKDDVLRSLCLIRDERHLVAYDLYRDARNRAELMGRRFGPPVESGNRDEGESVQSWPLVPTEQLEPPASKQSGDDAPIRRNFLAKNLFRGNQKQTEWASGERKSDTDRKPSAEERERQDLEDARELLEKNAEEFQKLEKRALLFHRAKQNLTIDDDWIKAQTLFGITTYYRHEADKSLSIKLEGELIGIPLFEQLAVLREADLYHTWAPFCSASQRLAQLGRIDVVAWFMTGLPTFGLCRDACFRAVGCDCMREDGSILLVGEGLGDKEEDGVRSSAALSKDRPAQKGTDVVDEQLKQASERPPLSSKTTATGYLARSASGFDSYGDSSYDGRFSLSRFGLSSENDGNPTAGSYLSRDSILDTIQIPPIPTKFGSGRMTIRSFQGVIDVLSPSSARTRLVSNIDPNLRFLPQVLVDFCMKKMCGVLLSRLQGTARKIIKDPVRSVHARRMREDTQFYKQWLLPKFQSYCEDLGWEMPPVAAFNVSKEDLDVEEWLLYSRTDDGGVIRKSMSTGDLEGMPVARLPDTVASAATAHNFTFDPGANTNTTSGTQQARSLPPSPDMSAASAPAPGLDVNPLGIPQQKLFTSPKNLIKDWEAKKQRKKALQVASARRKAQLQIKPQPLSKEMQCRVWELKEAKRRYAEREADDQSVSTVISTARSVRIAGNESSDASVVSKEMESDTILNQILCVLTGCHPSLPAAKVLPFLLVVMFSIYQVDAGALLLPLGLQNHDPQVVFGISSLSMMRLLIREILFVFILTIYAALHWSVVNSTFVAAFDSVKLPGGVNSTGLKKAKGLYLDSVKVYAAIFTLLIMGLCTGRAIVLSLWTDVLLYYMARGGSYVSKMSATTWGVIEAQYHDIWTTTNSTSARPMFSARIIEVALSFKSETGRLLKPVVASLIVSVSRTVSWTNKVIWSNSIASFFFKAISIGISSLAWGLSAVHGLVATFAGDSSSRPPWRQSALDSTKTVMSYSAVFLFSTLLVAGILVPKQKIVDQENSSPASGLMNRRSDSDGSHVASTQSASKEITPSGSMESSSASDGADEEMRSGSHFQSTNRRRDAQTKHLRGIATREEIIYEDEQEYEEDTGTDLGGQCIESSPASTAVDDDVKKGGGKPLKKMNKVRQKLLGLKNRKKSKRSSQVGTENQSGPIRQ